MNQEQHKRILRNLARIQIGKPLMQSTDIGYIIQKEEEVRRCAEEQGIQDPVVVAVGGGPYSTVLYTIICSRESAEKLREEEIKHAFNPQLSALMLDLAWFERKKERLNGQYH